MRWLGTAGIAAMLVALGCAGTSVPKGPATETPPPREPSPALEVPPAPPGQGLGLSALQNATYRWGEGNRYSLAFRDGKFRGPIEPGSIDEIRVSMLERVGRGDLDGDGIEDAAVVLINDPGGTEIFYVLVAVLNQGGSPDPVGNLLLGDDEIQVGGLSIEDGKIWVDVVRPAEDVPSSAPTRRIKESYKLVYGRLERADKYR